ncbi:MAG: hypothetical protein D6674_04135 [Acidobacteria bacterium]|jgi:predicted nucleic-acid-binding protein|nr:MAG: hypothetical protein D6674_04135 [Acidobacteriota bacterium]
MDAIETADLLDFLTRGEKVERVESYFRAVEKKKGKVFLSNYTLLELVYLLEHVYGISREDIVKSIRIIIEDRLFKVENASEVEEALGFYEGGMDFLQSLKEAQYRRRGLRRIEL